MYTPRKKPADNDDGLVVGQSTMLAEFLNKAMKEKGVSKQELAKVTRISFEHIRKTMNGMVLPGAVYLRMICQELELDYDEMERLRKIDDIRRQYGDEFLAEYFKKEPGISPLERVWPLLNSSDRKKVVEFARSLAKARE